MADIALAIGVSGFDAQLDVARYAQSKGVHDLAFELYSRLHNRFPERVEPVLLTIRLLREREMLLEAEAILEVVQDHFPQEVALFAEYAQLAAGKGDWVEALRRWEITRQRLPDQSLGWRGSAQALIALNRLDEAESLLAAAAARFPADIDLLQESAQAAEARQDWAAALQRWQAARVQSPDLHLAYRGEVAALRRLGRLDDERNVALAAADRFPEETEWLQHLAHMAQDRGDWVEAGRYWRASLALNEEQWWAHTSLAEALYWQGHRAESLALFEQLGQGRARTDAQLAARMVHFLSSRMETSLIPLIETLDACLENHVKMAPSPRDVLVAYADAARLLQNYVGYRRRIDRMLLSFPDDLIVRRIAHDAQELFPLNADLTEAVECARATGVFADDQFSDAHFIHFEGLGGSGYRIGCEFGFVQRALGVEPLGLLRWAAVAPSRLATALEQRFGGLGERPDTSLFRDETAQDWGVTDLRYGIRMAHTHIPKDTVDEEAAFKLVSSRLRILSRKLLSNIESGKKIFVHRMACKLFSPDEMSSLLRIASLYPKAKFLWIQEEAGRGIDDIDFVAMTPNILLVTRRDMGPNFDLSDQATLDSWKTICGEAWRRWHSAFEGKNIASAA